MDRAGVFQAYIPGGVDDASRFEAALAAQIELLLEEEAAEGDPAEARKHGWPRKRRPKGKKKAAAGTDVQAAGADAAGVGEPAPAGDGQLSTAPPTEGNKGGLDKGGLQNFFASRPSVDDLRASGILRGNPSARQDPGVRAAAEAIRKLLQRDALARQLRNRLSAVDLRQRGILRDPETEARSSAIEALARALQNRPPREELARLLARYTPKEIMVWTGLEVHAVVPIGARNCHAAVLHGRRLYILGGHSEGEVEHPLSPAILDADKGTGWQRPPTWTAAGFEPVSRYAHSVVDFHGVLVLFGGYSASSGWTNDVWLLDIRPGQTREDTPALAGASSGVGGRRSAISMPADFGLSVLQQQTGDVEGTPPAASHTASHTAQPVPDLLTWHLPPIGGTPPAPRAAHTATLLAGAMLVFGGNDGSMLYNDTLCLVLTPMDSTLTWMAVVPAGTAPSPRSGHTAVAHNESKVVIFGGGEGWGGNCFNDLFVLKVEPLALSHLDAGTGTKQASPPSLMWIRPAFTGTPPGPRTGHTACAIGDSMLVFAGFDGRRALNDLHILDLRTMAWSRPADTGAVPISRAGHTATAVGAYCLVFGGSRADGEIFGDVHVLDTLHFNVVEGTSSTSAAAGTAGGASSSHLPRMQEHRDSKASVESADSTISGMSARADEKIKASGIRQLAAVLKQRVSAAEAKRLAPSIEHQPGQPAHHVPAGMTRSIVVDRSAGDGPSAILVAALDPSNALGAGAGEEMQAARGGIASWPRSTAVRTASRAVDEGPSTHILDGPLTGLTGRSKSMHGPLGMPVPVRPTQTQSGRVQQEGRRVAAGASLQADLVGLMDSIGRGSPLPDLGTAIQLLRAEVMRQALADESRYDALAAEIQAQRAERRVQHKSILSTIEGLRLTVAGLSAVPVSNPVIPSIAVEAQIPELVGAAAVTVPPDAE